MTSTYKKRNTMEEKKEQEGNTKMMQKWVNRSE